MYHIFDHLHAVGTFVKYLEFVTQTTVGIIQTQATQIQVRMQ